MPSNKWHKIKFLKCSTVQEEILIIYALPSVYHPTHIHFEDQRFFYLIFELAEGGNLMSKVTKERFLIERTAAQLFREVVLAVEYLHFHVPAIIHRDIKPENILLSTDSRVKLTGLGWSN